MKVALIGPITTSQIIQVERGGFFIGVRFRPGCRIGVSNRLFSSLKDTNTSTFLPSSTSITDFQKSIQKPLTHENIHSQLRLLVETLLIENVIAQDPIVDKFLDEVKRIDDSTSVSNILKRLLLSARQFQRRLNSTRV